MTYTAAKVSRVIISAGIFALMHTERWGNGNYSEVGINGDFIGGLVYAVATEYTGCIGLSVALHISNNFFLSLLIAKLKN